MSGYVCRRRLGSTWTVWVAAGVSPLTFGRIGASQVLRTGVIVGDSAAGGTQEVQPRQIVVRARALGKRGRRVGSTIRIVAHDSRMYRASQEKDGGRVLQSYAVSLRVIRGGMTRSRSEAVGGRVTVRE